MLRRLVLIGAAALVAGCASVQQLPLSASSAEALRGKEVILAERARPSFDAVTADKAMFGAIGAVAMSSVGNDIVKKNDIQDPAVYIGQTLAGELGARYSIRRSPKGAPIATEEAADLARIAAAADLALDVRTTSWMFVYYPTAWTRYRVVYHAHLRLVDTKSGQVVAEGGCRRMPEEVASAPTYEELLANNAARLKQELRTAAEYCLNEFRTKTLAL